MLYIYDSMYVTCGPIYVTVMDVLRADVCMFVTVCVRARVCVCDGFKFIYAGGAKKICIYMCTYECICINLVTCDVHFNFLFGCESDVKERERETHTRVVSTLTLLSTYYS